MSFHTDIPSGVYKGFDHVDTGAYWQFEPHPTEMAVLDMWNTEYIKPRQF